MSEWRAVPGFEGKYEVSDDGQVRSLVRKEPHILRAHPGTTSRYLKVSLGAGNQRMVHTLVAEAFLGPRPPGLEIRHLDGDHLNNRADNLAYGTVRENRQDTVRHGHHHYAKRTHCAQGHEFSPENTYLYTRKTGLQTRACRACEAERSARRSAAGKEVAA